MKYEVPEKNHWLTAWNKEVDERLFRSIFTDFVKSNKDWHDAKYCSSNDSMQKGGIVGYYGIFLTHPQNYGDKLFGNLHFGYHIILANICGTNGEISKHIILNRFGCASVLDENGKEIFPSVPQIKEHTLYCAKDEERDIAKIRKILRDDSKGRLNVSKFFPRSSRT